MLSKSRSSKDGKQGIVGAERLTAKLVKSGERDVAELNSVSPPQESET